MILKKNICLTGFMGSGKTTVGEILASRLGVEFWDSDELLVHREGIGINEIFQRYGEKYFRDKEAEILKFLAQKPPGTCVIATGGGAVLREKNLIALQANGMIVNLEVSALEACHRLKGAIEVKGRPLLEGDSSLARIKAMLAQRRPYYLQAGYRVDSNMQSPSMIATEIIDFLIDRGYLQPG